MAHFWAPAICAVIRPRIPGGTSAAMYAWQVLIPWPHWSNLAKPTTRDHWDMFSGSTRGAEGSRAWYNRLDCYVHPSNCLGCFGFFGCLGCWGSFTLTHNDHHPTSSMAKDCSMKHDKHGWSPSVRYRKMCCQCRQSCGWPVGHKRIGLRMTTRPWPPWTAKRKKLQAGAHPLFPKCFQISQTQCNMCNE